MLEKNQTQTRIKKFMFVLVVTFVIGFTVHGYCYFNSLFSHDSLLINQISDNSWQISIGRFLQPIYLKLRGGVYPSSIIGILSLIFISMTTYIIVDCFKITHKIFIAIVCGIMVVNPSLSMLNASFLCWSDVFMFAMLLATVGAVCIRKSDRIIVHIVGCLLIFCGISLYQSSIGFACGILVLVLLNDVIDGIKTRVIIKRGLRYILCLFMSLLVYAIVYKIILSITGIQASDSYNSLNSVGKFEGVTGVIRALAYTYGKFIVYFIKPNSHLPLLVTIINIFFLSVICICYMMLVKKNGLRMSAILLSLFLIAIVPLSINIVCFISNGMEHILMMYPFVITYVFGLGLLEKYSMREMKIEYSKGAYTSKFTKIRCTVIAGLICCLLCNAIYANQAYEKKYLDSQATLSVITRIIDKVEQVDGYKVGVTPVVIIGDLDKSQVNGQRTGFDSSAYAMNYNFSVTYFNTYANYINNFLNYPMNILSPSESSVYYSDERVLQMPAFPNSGYCSMIDDAIVIKLSDEW